GSIPVVSTDSSCLEVSAAASSSHRKEMTDRLGLHPAHRPIPQLNLHDVEGERPQPAPDLAGVTFRDHVGAAEAQPTAPAPLQAGEPAPLQLPVKGVESA